jgi:hypothetical protein
MAIVDEIKQALRGAGEQLKKDLWRPEDDQFLEARAQDLARLEGKALAATNPAKKKGFQTAANDVIEHVKAVALIRIEAARDHLVDLIGRIFMEKLLPALVRLLPALLAL